MFKYQELQNKSNNRQGGNDYNKGNRGRGGLSYNRGGRGGHDGDGHKNYGRTNNGNWLTVDTEEKKKLREAAQAQKAKMTLEKNEAQKIKLILNVITPDNRTKKMNELRGFMFPNLMTQDECFKEEIDY